MAFDIIEFIRTSGKRMFAVTGNAGSGKTTLTKSLPKDFTVYSMDYRFIGDGKYRKELLKKKNEIALESYIDACNQINWWNWAQVEHDIDLLQKGVARDIDEIYDRDTGKVIPGSRLFNGKNPFIIVEGALLGTYGILNRFDYIFFVYTPRELRFQRLLEKDKNRRTLNEILARFLITEYSENLYYTELFKEYGDRIIILQDGQPIPFRNEILTTQQYIPIIL